MAQLHVLPGSEVALTKLNSRRLQIVAISVSIVAVFLMASVAFVLRKFWRERKKKKQVGSATYYES